MTQSAEGRGTKSVWISVPSIALGAAVLFTPLLPWLWGLLPGYGPVITAFAVGTGLVVHGLVSVLRAFREDTDGRLATILAALASLLVGAIAFSWPVFTLFIFRIALGAWLVFVGLHLIATFFSRQRAQKAPRKRWLKTAGATLSLVVAVALAFGSNFLLGGAHLPIAGPFYSAPETEIAHLGAPGTLIRSEPLVVGVPNGAEAWKILYTTTNVDGSAAISSGTVMAPMKRGDDDLPLLSIAHGTTGVATGCAPSLSHTPFADGAGAALNTMVVDHGWAAVTSDYVGLGTAGTHPYLIGEVEARNVLDASLAAQQLEHVSVTSRTVVWGHSQGGQGALWAGQIAEDYAPALTVEGIAAFAPASDLLQLAEAVKTTAAGKVVSAYIASTWSGIYPELQLSENLTPGSRGGVQRIQGLCFNGFDVVSAALSGTQIPNQIFPDDLLDGSFGTLLSEQEPVGPFPGPVFVAQGLADTLVSPQLQRDWVSARCAAGDEIDYREYAGLGHVDVVAAESPLTAEIVDWTRDRWAGGSPTPNCAKS